MNQGEKFIADILSVLDLFSRKFIIENLTPKTGEAVTINIYSSDLNRYEMSPETAGEIIFLLTQEEKAIKLLAGYSEDDLYENDSNGYAIENPSFVVSLPKSFADIHENLILRHENKNKNGSVKKKMEGIILYFTKDGELWREPKSKYCYEMMTEKGRQKMLRYFIEQKNNGYISTGQIASDLSKTAQGIRTEVHKINSNAQNSLHFKDDLIEGKQGSGYRLNPNIKIKDR